MNQVEHVVKIEVAFSNAYLAKNFQDGMIWKLDNMKSFLLERIKTDEERAQKMVDNEQQDDPQFEKLVGLLGANEESLKEIRTALERSVSEFKTRWNETPPSLLPKEKRPGFAKKESLDAIRARFVKKAA